MRGFLVLGLLVLSLGGFSSEKMKKDIVFGEAGGETLKLDAHIPDGEGPFPVVVAVHGGGWTKGDKGGEVRPIYEPLRSAGFLVFSINYRLSPKFYFPAMNEDVDTAVRWAKVHAAEFKGDAQRLALLGCSAGGYLVTYSAATGKEAVRAVVAFYPPTNLESRVRDSGQMKTAGALTGIKDVNEETFQKLHAISPIYMLRAGMPPHLILHGDKDPQVPHEQSVAFQKKMMELGNTCELITIPDGAHGVTTWDKLKRDYRTPMIDWLKNALK